MMSDSMNFLDAIMNGNEEAMHYAVYLYEEAEKQKYMDESAPIYLITLFTKIEPDDKFMAKFGDSRVVGYYHNKKDAFSMVKANCCDIWESCYNWAIIEEVSPGLCPHCEHRWFFMYNENIDEYEEISEPECVKHFINFSIG